MQFIDTVLSYCGWTGVALAAVLLLMLGIQLYYYLVAYGRIPGYKNSRRRRVLDHEPPISVVIPMFRRITPSSRSASRSFWPRATPISRW